MIRKYVIVALSLAAFTAPAFAATEYWVVKNAATKKCEISDKMPDAKTMLEVGKAMYKTKAEAETAMKAAAECK